MHALVAQIPCLDSAQPLGASSGIRGERRDSLEAIAWNEAILLTYVSFGRIDELVEDCCVTRNEIADIFSYELVHGWCDGR